MASYIATIDGLDLGRVGVTWTPAYRPMMPDVKAGRPAPQAAVQAKISVARAEARKAVRVEAREMWKGRLDAALRRLQAFDARGGGSPQARYAATRIIVEAALRVRLADRLAKMAEHRANLWRGKMQRGLSGLGQTAATNAIDSSMQQDQATAEAGEAEVQTALNQVPAGGWTFGQALAYVRGVLPTAVAAVAATPMVPSVPVPMMQKMLAPSAPEAAPAVPASAPSVPTPFRLRITPWLLIGGAVLAWRLLR